MSPILKIDLRQIHADTVRALSENKRQHDERQTAIMQLLAEALKETRQSVDVSLDGMANITGYLPVELNAYESGRFMPSQKIMEHYIALAESRKLLPVPPLPANVPRIHLLTTQLRPGVRGPGESRLWLHGAACGAHDGERGGPERVTCERCLVTPIFDAMRKAIHESKQ